MSCLLQRIFGACQNGRGRENCVTGRLRKQMKFGNQDVELKIWGIGIGKPNNTRFKLDSEWN